MAKTPKLIAEEGDHVGFVTLNRLLGQPGEQGEVWLAHASDNKDVAFAVKLSKRSIVAKTDRAYAKFAQEFHNLASCIHPNIVKVFHCDVFPKKAKQFPYYLMEYLGENTYPLQKAVEENQKKRASLCLRALFDTASALNYVHREKKGYHGDVKASNILISNPASPKPDIRLIDFGFSQLLPATARSGRPVKPSRPTKPSSLRPPKQPKSNEHLDIWALTYTIRDLLFEETVDELRVAGDRHDWPIDYADSQRLEQLLKDWSSAAPRCLAETGESDAFYNELNELSQNANPTSLDPDVKGAVRYLSIPEIATAAKVQPAFEAIRIPPRQLVLYTERIKRIITEPTFGALRYTRQLGLTHLVYPGAQGTRFEHSLGVYDLACRFVIRMAAQPDFRRICNEPKDVLKFILAALLHDIGHYPLAHQIEEFSIDDFDTKGKTVVRSLLGGHHERGHNVLGQSLCKQLCHDFALSIEDINEVMAIASLELPTFNSWRPALRLFRFLLDGSIDLDKLDYVERDAHHCGVPYGNYLDIERILETMRIVLEPGKIPMLAFDRRGVGCLEQLASARHQMYANVYWHRAVRSATAMFKHAFYLFQELLGSAARVEDIFFNAGSDDAVLKEMINSIEEFPEAPQVRAIRQLLSAVSGRNRTLYKEFVDNPHEGKYRKAYGGDFYPAQRDKAMYIYEELRQKNMLTLEADSIGAHSVLIDLHEDISPPFWDVQILMEDRTPKDLGKIAPSVTKLGDTFTSQACRIRVLINADVLKPDYRDKGNRAPVEHTIRALLE